MHRVTLILVAAVWSLTAEAGVYKWTDEQGRVHFSDRKMDMNSEEVQLKPSTSSPQPAVDQAERERKRRRLLDVYREDRSKKRAKLEKQQQAKAEKKQKCHNAQRRYARFNRAGGIYDTDKNGERRYLNHEKRAQYMTELQTAVDRWCAK